MQSNRRILVTGGAGFVGSHLCERLLDTGNKVICVDNFSTGAKKNVKHLLGNKLFRVVEHDITEPLSLQVDQIYNLACPASPVHYKHNPIHTTKTSVLGAINMLELARREKARITQASTSEVYGDPEQHPQKEDYFGNVNPNGLRSCYDEGKRCAETLFFDYHRSHGIEIKVARIFNTYRPRMSPGDGRVVSNFICQALKGKPITLYGDGSQSRSFCYVEDMIDGLIRLMESPRKVIGPINLGNPGEFSVAQLAEKVLQLTGSNSEIVYKPLPPDDPRRRKPDISRADKALSWKPRVNLTDGLKLTIHYFKQTLESQNIATHKCTNTADFQLASVDR